DLKNYHRNLYLQKFLHRLSKALSLPEILKLPGSKAIMLCFFCYCAVEQTTGLWASSYLTTSKGIAPEVAAGLAAMFFLGITIGRAFSGFLTIKFNDSQMIKMGFSVIAIGLTAMFLPWDANISYLGLILIGLGCAPIYPSIIHSVPTHFGAEYSQPVIGVLMASAYTGTLIMPPLFGVIAQFTGVSLLPIYLTLILALMVFMYKKLLSQTILQEN
ncbi:MAG: MFS transporter, partial [Clostridiaceae bacterium]